MNTCSLSGYYCIVFINLFISMVIGLFRFECYSDFVFFKQKTAYEMRISDWSSDVCSSDLAILRPYHFKRRVWRSKALPNYYVRSVRALAPSYAPYPRSCFPGRHSSLGDQVDRKSAV